jgi:3-hydroxybutyryl-CoA dehydrogenase
MKILVVGEQSNLEEVARKFGKENVYTRIPNLDPGSSLEPYDYIFDFVIDELPEHFEEYIFSAHPIIFINTVKVSLGELQYTYGKSIPNIYGFNGLPTFLERDVLEVCTLFDKEIVSKTLNGLKTDWVLVDDRVGMVTARIILMIINEAYYTVQEGTASMEDIDKGMKLGTNYPFGPFEWCKRIGLQHVYETLEAIYEDTKDERYKIAPLLKQEYLKG